MNNRNIVKTILMLALFVLLSPPIISEAGTVNTLAGEYNSGNGTVAVTGTATEVEKNIVTVEIFKPNGALLYFGTVDLSLEGSFSSTVNVGSLSSGTYLIRSADYMGGIYRSTTFSVAGVAPEPEPSTEPSAENTTEPTKVETTPDEVLITVQTQVDSNGSLSGTISGEDVSKIENSTSSQIGIVVSDEGMTDKVKAIIESEALEVLNDIAFAALIIDTPVATMTFDKTFFDDLPSMADSSLTISAERVDTSKLAANLQQVVGSQPLYDFTALIGEQVISEFSKPVKITVPYTLNPGENPDNIIIYFLNDEGQLEVISNCVYNPETKRVSFSTFHFSYYFVGYESVTFKDVLKTDAYYDAVNFIAARGITNGVGENRFAPAQTLSRAQFIVMLFRAYGIQPEETSVNFSDAGNTYYTPYLGMAKQLGISNGMGENRFMPNKEITIQEIYTLIHRTLTITGQLPGEKNTTQITVFKDAINIASWARNPVKVLLNHGIIQNGIGFLTPTKTALRADMAQILYGALKP